MAKKDPVYNIAVIHVHKDFVFGFDNAKTEFIYIKKDKKHMRLLLE